MISSMNDLLKRSEVNVYEFDIHIRNEMMTIKRKLPCYVMSYHKKGEAKLRINNEVFNITPGTVILIPPNVEHDHYKETDDETVFFWTHFTFGIANAIDVLGIFQLPVIFKLKNPEQFEKVFLEYKDAKESNNFLSATIFKNAKAMELLYLMLEGVISYSNYTVQKVHTEEFLCILTDIIKYSDRELSLNGLSKKYHLHPTYISNRFKQLFNKTPIQIHRELRIGKAKKLLDSSQMSITDIGSKLGFNCHPTFTRLFKSYVGVSPTEYRDKGRTIAR